MQPNRRVFLGQVGAVTIAAGVLGIDVQAATGSNQRANECAKLRRDAATAAFKPRRKTSNIQTTRTKTSTQTKSVTTQKAYRITTTAPSCSAPTTRSPTHLTVGPADFDAIPLGGTTG